MQTHPVRLKKRPNILVEFSSDLVQEADPQAGGQEEWRLCILQRSEDGMPLGIPQFLCCRKFFITLAKGRQAQKMERPQLCKQHLLLDSVGGAVSVVSHPEQQTESLPIA